MYLSTSLLPSLVMSVICVTPGIIGSALIDPAKDDDPKGFVDLYGGVRYFDAQFDDARLAIDLAQTTFKLGGVALNYVQVVHFVKESSRICGVAARDQETGIEHEIRVFRRIFV
jgi:glycerol-3-phosphate dehydrogenase